MLDLILAFDLVGESPGRLAGSGFPGGLHGPQVFHDLLAVRDLLAEDVDLFAQALRFLSRKDPRQVHHAVGARQRPQGLVQVLRPLGPAHGRFGLAQRLLDVGDDPLALHLVGRGEHAEDGRFAFTGVLHGFLEPRFGLLGIRPQVQSLAIMNLGLVNLVLGHGLIAQFKFVFGLGTLRLLEDRQSAGGGGFRPHPRSRLRDHDDGRLINQLRGHDNGRFLNRLRGHRDGHFLNRLLGHDDGRHLDRLLSYDDGRLLGRLLSHDDGRLLDRLGRHGRRGFRRHRLDLGQLPLQIRQGSAIPPAEFHIEVLQFLDVLAGIGHAAVLVGLLAGFQEHLGPLGGLALLVLSQKEEALGLLGVAGLQVVAGRGLGQLRDGGRGLLGFEGGLAVIEGLRIGSLLRTGLLRLFQEGIVRPLVPETQLVAVHGQKALERPLVVVGRVQLLGFVQKLLGGRSGCGGCGSAGAVGSNHGGRHHPEQHPDQSHGEKCFAEFQNRPPCLGLRTDPDPTPPILGFCLPWQGIIGVVHPDPRQPSPPTSVFPSGV